ncbi:hypothetical protein IV203_003325 [Nitzschia inconspicua]|uniref:Uncharacterized protein n=1 Tax=Nitzschia inconspicua TaxID=303405 RepID=A0A9K3PQX7_9STRA|nr:hypothetical protein IV203_003325 [Nitzschia inconspicua]
MEAPRFSLRTDSQVSVESGNVGFKRFDTERIRRRMKEQQERVGSKGKMLSMAPMRVLSPPPPSPPQRLPSSQKIAIERAKNDSTDATKTSKPPPLAISITMSEAEEEIGNNHESGAETSAVNDFKALIDNVHSEFDQHLDSDSQSSQNVSVWAMLEHYNPPTETKENGLNDNHDSDDEMGQDFSTEGSSVKASRIHGTKYEKGEDVQMSFSNQENIDVSVQPGNVIENLDEGSSKDVVVISSPAMHEREAVFRMDNKIQTVDHASKQAIYAIAGKVPQVWLERTNMALNDDSSYTTRSLIEDSTNQRTRNDSEKYEVKSTSDEYDKCSSISYVLDSPRMAANKPPPASREASDSKSESASSAEQASATVEDFPAQVFTGSTDNERHNYISRIEELEKSLQAQQNNTNEVQDTLKGKMEELEQALRVTAATPRGTIIQENPLKTLLDRNQTLVKEVRFADQTCVELSSRIKELENHNESLMAENSTLHKQAAEWQKQTEELHQQVDVLQNTLCEPDSERDAKIDELTRALELASIDLQAKNIAEKNLLEMARDVFDELGLGLHDSSMGSLSLTTPSNPGNSEIDQSSILDNSGLEYSQTSLGNTDALQRLVMALIEKVREIRSTRLSPSIETNTSRWNNDLLEEQIGESRTKLQTQAGDLKMEGQQCNQPLNSLRVIESHQTFQAPSKKNLLESQRSPAGSTPQDMEGNFISCVADLTNLQSTLDVIKKESKLFFAQDGFIDPEPAGSSQKQHLLSEVNFFISRMKQRYKILEEELGNQVEVFDQKLDVLGKTVLFLTNSLVFESDAVSMRDNDIEVCELKQVPTDADQVIPATLESKISTLDDNDIYQMMEEARSPQQNNFEVLSDLDDMSRLLSDDFTLESTIRAGSVLSSVTHTEKLKEPLESAIKECTRVRERCLMLKEQINSQNATIEHLERENGRLSLNASRRGEETHLVEQALDEAKSEICKLQASLKSLQHEKEMMDHLAAEYNSELSVAQETNERLTKELTNLREENGSIGCRLTERTKMVQKLNEELAAMKKVCKGYKDHHDDLLNQLNTKELEMKQRVENEVSDARRSIQIAERELREERLLREDIAARLSRESTAKIKLEAECMELKNAEKQLLSDVEDRELAIQLERENMRKERAELKCRLKQAESEATKLKNTLEVFREKKSLEEEEQASVIAMLESQQSQLNRNIQHMKLGRSRFFDLIHRLGCCRENFSRLFCDQVLEHEKMSDCGFAACMSEIEIWKELIPIVGEEISALHQTISNLSDLEEEVEDLKEKLSTVELQGSEHLNQLHEERLQNEKLLSLLQQAEQEMERSTVQIKEMAESMKALQERENEAAAKAHTLASDLQQLRQVHELVQSKSSEERDQLKHLLEQKSAQLEECHLQLSEATFRSEQLKAGLETASIKRYSKESEVNRLNSIVESLEKKTSILRDYVRKLTVKCEEWEESYDKQSVAMEKLQLKNSKIREKAHLIAEKYKKLAGDVQQRKRMHQEDRTKWSSERSNLNHVHLQLEQELEQIARELSLSPQNVKHLCESEN